MEYKLVNENFEENFLENYLKFRGIEDKESFLNPTDIMVNEPNKLTNLKKGLNLLKNAVDENKKILIVVDSDVDGYTSAAEMYLYLKKIADSDAVIDYVLHTRKQRGISDMMDIAMNYELIIIPDASTNDYVYHEELAEHNIAVLVLDHHLLTEDQKISDNAVIINNQISPNYPNKGLTGAGVVFQFLTAFDKEFNYSYAEELIDLAAIGLVGDMADIRDFETRYLVKTGLLQIKQPFIDGILKKQEYSTKGAINYHTVGFYVAPLINAMIRVGTKEEKARCFLAFIDPFKEVPCNKRGMKGTFEKVYIESIRECVNAKAKQKRLMEKYSDVIEMRIHKYNLLENEILFIKLEEEDDLPQTLNGLLAMQLANKFNRPTMVGRLNEEERVYKGSIRGLNNSGLKSFRDLLLKSGQVESIQGHDNAAGFEVKETNLQGLFTKTNEELKKYNLGENVYEVNLILTPASSNIKKLANSLIQYEDIWGQKCEKPLICIEKIQIDYGNVRTMGADNKTIKFNMEGIDVIMFKATNFLEDIRRSGGKSLTIVGEFNRNVFRNTISAQFVIKDYKFVDDSLDF